MSLCGVVIFVVVEKREIEDMEIAVVELLLGLYSPQQQLLV